MAVAHTSWIYAHSPSYFEYHIKEKDQWSKENGDSDAAGQNKYQSYTYFIIVQQISETK